MDDEINFDSVCTFRFTINFLFATEINHLRLAGSVLFIYIAGQNASLLVFSSS